MLRLLLMMTVVPLTEVYLLAQLGNAFGAWPPVALVLLTGLIGAQMARREGASVLQRLSDQLNRGEMPAQALSEGALVFAGGLLLVTPGILTDFVGFALLVPFTRQRLAPLLIAWLGSRVANGGVHVYMGSPRPRSPSPKAPEHQDNPPFDHPVA